MQTMAARCVIAFLTLTLNVSVCLAQRPDPNSPRIDVVRAFQTLLQQANDDIQNQAKQLLSETNFDDLLKQVTAARKRVKGREVSDVILENESSGRFVYEIDDEAVTINFGMTLQQPIRINAISLAADKDQQGSVPRTPPVTWDNLEETLDQFAKDGFEGAVLVTRGGKVVLEKAYGLANREKEIKNSIETVFAIGSAPIDFTHAGILLLKDQGKLDLDDPITKFFSDVPADKRNITIRQLMTGGSGLPNFHDLPSDENPDHTWIDRDEAIRRIFAQPLLFEPGTGKQHSHSAWGVLAAIIEVVSGESYPQFTTQRLFKPAGMNDTGFFGQTVPEDRIAVGYGRKKSSEPNSPPNWGRTSWLVMGSGGQVSTLGDMLRWEQAMKSGKILSPESTKLYQRNGDGLSADGDDFGFEFMHSRNPDQLFMLITNTSNQEHRNQRFKQLGLQLYQLVSKGDSPAKYSLGIAMAVSSHDGVTVQRVVAGSAAEKDGLRVGDRLISANGEKFGEDPMDVLDPFLHSETPIEFEIIRDDQTLTLRVTPLAKK